ncbi:MAG TPA: hypothetical protein VFD48_13505 [Pyrinomonadaceae bacterium]|nr:hypothetical protein [Pyrinomonadaceae bacterium]
MAKTGPSVVSVQYRLYEWLTDQDLTCPPLSRAESVTPDVVIYIVFDVYEGDVCDDVAISEISSEVSAPTVATVFATVFWSVIRPLSQLPASP